MIKIINNTIIVNKLKKDMYVNLVILNIFLPSAFMYFVKIFLNNFKIKLVNQAYRNIIMCVLFVVMINNYR